MRKIISLALCFITWGTTSCQNRHVSEPKNPVEISVRLGGIQKDSVLVEYTIQGIEKDSLTFIIPKVIPGTYQTNNSGEYIIHFKTYDKEGKEMNSKRMDGNTYFIASASKLAKISYFVKKGKKNSTYDVLTKLVTTDSFWMINPVSIIGYFNDFRNAAYRLEVERNTHFSTSFIPAQKISSGTNDVFLFTNYDQLAETPLLYNDQPDTLSLTDTPIQANIIVYSDNKNLTASLLSQWIEPLLSTLDQYTSSSRDNKTPYRFIFIFSKDITSESALEQPDASAYCLKANYDTSNLRTSIIHMVAHEFLHTITPTRFHSDVFKSEKFTHFSSKHLWLYEGLVEYLAIKAQLENGVMNLDDYFRHLSMSDHLLSQNKNCKQVNLLNISSSILSDKGGYCFDKFYRKGCLLGFCLDLAIIECSKGEQNLMSVLNQYIKQKGLVFDEPNFLQEFFASTCLKNFDVDIPDKNLVQLVDLTLNKVGYQYTNNFWNYLTLMDFTFFVKDYSFKDTSLFVTFQNSPKLKNKTVQIKKINNLPANKESFNQYILYPVNELPIPIEYIEQNHYKSDTLFPDQKFSMFTMKRIEPLKNISSEMKENRSYLLRKVD